MPAAFVDSSSRRQTSRVLLRAVRDRLAVYRLRCLGDEVASLSRCGMDYLLPVFNLEHSLTVQFLLLTADDSILK